MTTILNRAEHVFEVFPESNFKPGEILPGIIDIHLTKHHFRGAAVVDSVYFEDRYINEPHLRTRRKFVTVAIYPVID